MNTKKCTTMRITRKKSPLVAEFYIEGQPLESVNVLKVWDCLLLVMLSHGINIETK